MEQHLKQRTEFLADELAATKDLPSRREPDRWLPDKYEPAVWVEEAVRLCDEECAVRELCLELGELRGERHGIYGGKTPAQRQTRRRRGIAPGAADFDESGEAA